MLEGSVRRAGERVRIWVQLVSVDNGYRLWCERYDRHIEDLFAVEDEIAERIAAALEVTLATRRAALEGGTVQPDAEAYELYLQGRQFFHQHRRKAFETALQVFARAIEVSPGYARAYAGIADCHSFLALYFGRAAESVAPADRASRRALELAPDLPDAHASRGLALLVGGDLDQAERHLRRAIALDPRLYEPHYIFGRVAFARGRHADAAEHFREACALVPEAYDSWYLLGMSYRKLGDRTRARNASFECIEAAKKSLRVHPDDTRAWTMGACSRRWASPNGPRRGSRGRSPSTPTSRSSATTPPVCSSRSAGATRPSPASRPRSARGPSRSTGPATTPISTPCAASRASCGSSTRPRTARDGTPPAAAIPVA